MSYLTIIEEQETFEYCPIDPATGAATQTVLTLRIVPDEQLKVCETVPEGFTAVTEVDGLIPKRLA